jgi:hypothetical protein
LRSISIIIIARSEGLLGVIKTSQALHYRNDIINK